MRKSRETEEQAQPTGKKQQQQQQKQLGNNSEQKLEKWTKKQT